MAITPLDELDARPKGITPLDEEPVAPKAAKASADPSLMDRVTSGVGGLLSRAVKPVTTLPASLWRATGKPLLEHPAQYLGETAADIATKMGGLGGALNKPLALAGALGSYTQPGQGSFNDRYMREMKGLQGRQEEASARSPLTAPAAEIAGYTMLPLSGGIGRSALAPMTEAASILPKTKIGAGARVVAGYGDLARFKLLGEDGSLPDINFSSMLASAIGPGAKELGPTLAARAANAESKANLHRASSAGISASDQPVVEDKLLGAKEYNPSRGRESVGQLAKPFVVAGEDTGQVAGRMGAANEEAKKVMEAARAAAEPTAKVNHTEVISEMEKLRDRLFSKADLTVPERETALRKVNDIIERVRNHFSPKVVGVMQQGVAAGPTTPETTYGPPARSAPQKSLDVLPGPVVHPSAVGESNLIPALDNRVIPGTNRPQPNTGWTPVVEEVPLSKFSELKTLWQGIAGSKPSGKPRTSAEIETKPVLEFFEGGGGILRRAEENAIAKVLPQEQAQAFNAAKRAYGVTETLLPMAQAAARGKEPMTILGQARHSWSPYHFGTRLGVGKLMPEESTLAAYQSGKADKMSYLSDVMGPAAKNPSYLAAIMAEIMRQKKGN